jgi:hypothetical protein
MSWCGCLAGSRLSALLLALAVLAVGVPAAQLLLAFSRLRRAEVQAVLDAERAPPAVAAAASDANATWRCENNTDCQLNGACVSGVCQCDKGWTGLRCHRLALLPLAPDAGLQDPVLSTWGGSVVFNATDSTWHMYVSVIENGCGLSAWRPNSALGHATATSPDGPYALLRIIKPHFAHEPSAVMAPDGACCAWRGLRGVRAACCASPESTSFGGGAPRGETSQASWCSANAFFAHSRHNHAVAPHL